MTEFEHALLLLLLVAGLSVVGSAASLAPPDHVPPRGRGRRVPARVPQVRARPGLLLPLLPPAAPLLGRLADADPRAPARQAPGAAPRDRACDLHDARGRLGRALRSCPGLPLAMAFALGAIVSPTDAVAVNAATEHLRVPARITTILNGESLMNDATGLVGFRFALAAVVAGTFSPARAALEFTLLAVGGFAVGLAAGYGVGRLRDLLRHLQASDTMIEITLSLMTPYAAYLLAERVGASGVLSVVAAGLYSGWRDPVRMDAETRQNAFGVWSLAHLLAERDRVRAARAAIPVAVRRREPPVLRAAAPRADCRRVGSRDAGADRVGLPGHLPALPAAGRPQEGDARGARAPSSSSAGPACAAPSPWPPRCRSRSPSPTARRSRGATSSSSWPSASS